MMINAIHEVPIFVHDLFLSGNWKLQSYLWPLKLIVTEKTHKMTMIWVNAHAFVETCDSVSLNPLHPSDSIILTCINK